MCSIAQENSRVDAKKNCSWKSVSTQMLKIIPSFCFKISHKQFEKCSKNRAKFDAIVFACAKIYKCPKYMSVYLILVKL